MALTKSAGSICDWTALASGTVAVAGQLDVSDKYETTVVIQAFVDADNTANAGTEFLVQGRAASTDTNEDWYDICRFVDLVGTNQAISLGEDVAVDEERVTVDENPTTIITIGTSDGPLPWVGIEDGTLADSEMIMATDGDADEIWALLSNEAGSEYFENIHDTNDTANQIAFSRGVVIGIGHYRIRVVVNNNYDTNGPSINFRVRYVAVNGV